MTIAKHNGKLHIGINFADCFIGKPASHGWVEIDGGNRLSWVSTLNQDDSCAALRRAIESENKRATGFMSQAI